MEPAVATSSYVKLEDLGRMDETELRAFGQRVARARVNAGWSKEEAARRAGISSITWKRVEDGLAVRDEKRGAVVDLLPDMELPPAERIELERARVAERHARSLERVDELRARRAVDPELDEWLRRTTEEDRAARAVIWPEGVSRTEEAALGAWAVLREQHWNARDRVRAVAQLLRDAREESELLEAQVEALKRFLKDRLDRDREAARAAQAGPGTD